MEKVKELAKNKYYVAGAIALVVILIVLLITRSTPVKSTEQFFEALQKGDVKKVSNLIYWDEDDDDYDLDDIDTDEIIDEMVESMEDEEFQYKVGDATISKDSARVKVKIKVEDEDSETGKIYLKKVHSKWKIDMIKTMKKGLDL